MNHSDIYWVALRLAGLIAALKAAYDLFMLSASGLYRIYIAFFDPRTEDCASFITELTTMGMFIPALINVLFFGLIAYYCLFKGGKLHALLMRLSVGNQP